MSNNDPQVLTHKIDELERSKNKLQKKIDKIQKEVDKIQREIDKQSELLQKCCSHGITNKYYETYEGSYLDRGYYITKYVCELCGMVLHTERKDTGYG